MGTPVRAVAAAILILGLAHGATAQRRGHPQLYDPRTVETVTGQVTAVERVERDGHPRPGLHVTLEVGGQTLPIRLGPAWYLAQEGLTPALGDRLTVKGSRVSVGGAPVVIAAEVTRGERTVVLRDQRGLPRWGRRAARP